MSLRAILGYAGTAVASLAVFAGFAFTGVTNQAMAGPASYAVQAAPAYTTSPITKAIKVTEKEPKAATAPKVAAGPFLASTNLYSVRNGDTLSSISSRMYGKAADWTVIYYGNKSNIKNPDLIYTGQTFRIPPLPRHIPAAPQPQTPAPVAAPATAAVAVSTSTPSQQQTTSNNTNYLTNGGGYSVSSGFQACVIRAESGGNPQIWNASGHWGLYQFSYGTWVAHGGAPADFGHAGGAEQTVVFWQTVHDDGTSDWAPYDGC